MIKSLDKLIIKCENIQFFIISSILTILFFFPALINNSKDSGILYTGDIVGFYIPAILKTYQLVHSYIFTAIDYSLFNGSSDYFISPNFFTFHPLFIFYYLISSPKVVNVQSAGQIIMQAMAIHTFLSCYFSILLFRQFYKLDYLISIFAACSFSFSVLATGAFGQVPFYFVYTLTPVLSYTCLCFTLNRSFSNLLISAVPTVLIICGGYIPLGLACIFISTIIGGCAVVIKRNNNGSIYLTKTKAIREFIYFLFPIIFGLLICSPYIASLYLFNLETTSASVTNIFYSAQQLSADPKSLLSVFSDSLINPKTLREFGVVIGILPISIIILFIVTESGKLLNKQENYLLTVSLSIYIFILFSIFGVYSVASSLVYYFIPFIGKMHIYQRFLLPAGLALSGALSVMLSGLTKVNGVKYYRYFFIFIMLFLFITVLLLNFWENGARSYGLNEYIIIELIGLLVFVSLLVNAESKTILIVGIIFTIMPAFLKSYTLTQGGNTYTNQLGRLKVHLDYDERVKIVDFIKKYSKKEIVKYVDLTPMWNASGIENFPKDFPYLVTNEVNLSSYGGFTFYLSARADYLSLMPVKDDVRLLPDWNWVINSGAEFVVMFAEDLNDKLAWMHEKTDDLPVYHLPNNAVIVFIGDKISEENRGLIALDNGILRVKEVNSFDEGENIALKKAVRHSSTINSGALLTDGIRDGDFAKGSVFHSKEEVNPWVEVDLGDKFRVNKVKIWNRSDCCQDRANKLWIFVSDSPIDDRDIDSSLINNNKIYKVSAVINGNVLILNHLNFNGRYVRAAVESSPDGKPTYLHLAEIEVFGTKNLDNAQHNIYNSELISDHTFYTNNANYIKLDVTLTRQARLEYLFFRNPRLNFYVDGLLRELSNEEIPTLIINSGHHLIEISYNNIFIQIFWVFYLFFWVLVAFMFFIYTVNAIRQIKRNINKQYIVFLD